MSQAVKMLDMDRVCFICTDNRYDEILLNKPTRIFEYNGNGSVRDYTITNKNFGYPKISTESIKGSSPSHNAEIIRGLFSEGKKSPGFYVVAANAALALYVAGVSDNLHTCKDRAEQAILDGKAIEKLDALIEYGNSV